MTDDIVANPALLIRRSVADVFEAFVDPEITSRFWFSSGDRRLAPGATATWTWAMYGFSTTATVTAFDPPRWIAFDWDLGDHTNRVEWAFDARGPEATFVTVRQSGFSGSDAERLTAALDGMGGFALVLAGAKIWLEHGVEPRFVVDRHPDSLVPGWSQD